ncbi:type IV pilus biogenesis protein PilP [Burkholderia territorii]|uniref:type IV pilus biogenesis protein PilP n=1 Tax=Burkholderia territorii TaxID=1503055 RepID=UPI0009BE20DD|nr:type IV pilus biogenesis protein PilP [Burkholderia territorii]
MKIRSLSMFALVATLALNAAHAAPSGAAQAVSASVVQAAADRVTTAASAPGASPSAVVSPIPAAQPGAASTLPAAASAPGKTDKTVAEQLQELQSENALLTLRAANAKLQADIRASLQAGKRTADASESATLPAAGAAATQQNYPIQQPIRDTRNPSSSRFLSGEATQVVEISSYEGRYRAVLDVDGVRVEVERGDKLRDGSRVERITDSTVILVRGKRARMIGL